MMIVDYAEQPTKSESEEFQCDRIFCGILKQFMEYYDLEERYQLLLKTLNIDMKPFLMTNSNNERKIYNLTLVMILMAIKRNLFFLLKKGDLEEKLLLDWFFLHEKFYGFFFKIFKATARGEYHELVRRVIHFDSKIDAIKGIRIFNTPLPVIKCLLMLNLIKNSLSDLVYQKTKILLNKMKSEGYDFSGRNIYGILASAIYLVSRKNNLFMNEAKVKELLSISVASLKRRKKEIKQYL